MSSIPDKFRSHLGHTKKDTKGTVILGGGLAGLSAGYCLAQNRHPVLVLESGSDVGGLSRTIRKGPFLFDLGGHRFHTQNDETNQFVRNVLKDDCLTVPRKSKIYLKNKFFDYPLKPANALFSLGVGTTVKALADYIHEKIKNLYRTSRDVSLEDWVISHFGRTMYEIYFKEYSEKVWGIPCDSISEEWVSQRIKGLSLGVAVKNAFFSYSGRNVNTLVDNFIYPPYGIGQLSDNMKDAIEKDNTVLTNTRALQINHKNRTIRGVIAQNCKDYYDISGNDFVSSIPLTHLVEMLNPAPPEDVLKAARKLRYRDLVIVALMLDKERVTDLTWMYIPEQSMRLGRIHEPKNWSPHMAPKDKTLVVAEYFCFQGDDIWNSSDKELTGMTAQSLSRLGFIQDSDVTDHCIVRVPRAYPVFEVGYRAHYEKLLHYLDQFTNLHIAGRTGTFQYYNMDRAIESGMEIAEHIHLSKSIVHDPAPHTVGA